MILKVKHQLRSPDSQLEEGVLADISNEGNLCHLLQSWTTKVNKLLYRLDLLDYAI
jgi:hypothetical protein